jgi:cysteine desulfurase / selenocysteine lyase
MRKNSRKIFFSYATVAQMSDVVYRAVNLFLDEFYVIGPPEVLYKYDPLMNDLAAEAAKLINCSPEEITYIKNTTEGIYIASEALPLHAGDEVLVLGNEYPANLLPWLKKRKDGIVVRVIDAPDNKTGFELLLAAIGAQTKAIAISTAQYYDGFMMDMATLSNTCRQKGIFLVLDAVQSIGIRKIDLQKIQADFLVCGGQKYLQAGLGIGFMYVNKKTIKHLNDVKVGIRSMQYFDHETYVLKEGAARFQDGTQNMAGIVALHAALKRVNAIGIEKIERLNMRLLKQIKACLDAYGIAYIDHGANQSNIVSMKVDDPQGLFEYLKEKSIYIKPIKDVARMSFTHETQLSDVELLAKHTRQWMNVRNQGLKKDVSYTPRKIGYQSRAIARLSRS